MIALNFIDKELIALNGHETIPEALDLMKKMGLTELPVLEGIYFKGMLSESELLKPEEQYITVDQISLQTIEPVVEQCHFFEIWSRLVESHMSCIGVVNGRNEYLGSIRQQTLIQFYKQSFALTEPGCIIVLSQRKLDYSLSKIATLVEENDCVILSSFVTETSDQGNILITLKLNRTDPRSIVQSLQRHDIDIVDVFGEETFSDLLNERFNMLMSYLNL